MTEDEGSLEYLYRCRAILSAAVISQMRQEKPSLDELHALGSAIVSSLSQMGKLSEVLYRQVGSFDDEELKRAKLSDHPEDKLKVAGTYLIKLKEELDRATGHAGQYWAAVENADEHTSTDFS